MEFNPKELIKSPLNYVGGKYKLLPQILPLFPDNINTFYDVFGGGANVSINVKANKIIYNDLITELVNLLNNLYKTNTEECLKQIDNTINTYNLTKENKEGFIKLRNDYNNGNKEWYIFYTLICYCFNNQIRFNNNHEFNSSFGKNRSSFNLTLRNKFINFVNKLHKLNINFINKDFKEVIDFSEINKNDFIYLDPPYLVSCAVYQDGKRGYKGWKSQDNLDLLNLCDKLNSNNIKFALSNVIKSKDKTNEILKEWSKQYNIHYINNTYKNCNYHRKDNQDNETIEVLVTNY